MSVLDAKTMTPEELYARTDVWCFAGEEWRLIPGCKYYEASTYGRIRSIDRDIVHINCLKPHHYDGVILVPLMTETGYYAVTIRKEGDTARPHKVHRLVAETWVDNPNNLPYINHKDEIKTNNKANNLEFCTALYNVHYGNGMRKCQEAGQKYWNSEYRIVQYDIFGNEIRRWHHAHEAELATGATDINNCLTGRAWTSNGFVWKRVGEPFDYPGRKEFIVQLDLNGNYIATYLNRKEAAKAVGIGANAIGNAMLKRNGKTRHFIFIKYSDYEETKRA